MSLRQNVRNISHELMPPEFNHLSIDKIIGYYLTDMQKTYGFVLAYEASFRTHVGNGFHKKLLTKYTV
ncbi:hypothetical protein NXX53_19510 [Bacteroides salyersiae]|nr:hypothetical protein [Bacteroides salyersiae]